MTRLGRLLVLAGVIVAILLCATPWLWAQAPSANPASSAPAPAPARSALAFLFPVLLTLIFLGCVALMYTEGIWSNAIRLVNVVTAALLATNFWEPVSRWLEGHGESFSYYWDLLALWVLFAVIVLALQSVTGALSKVKLKFMKIVDDIGGGILAAWVAWVMICFVTFSLHTAPLARDFMFGGFDADSRMFMGLAPDRQWLGFMQSMSRGAYCRYGGEQESQSGAYGVESEPSSPDQKLCVFDREARFIPKYSARRSALEKNVAEKGATRVAVGSFPKR